MKLLRRTLTINLELELFHDERIHYIRYMKLSRRALLGSLLSKANHEKLFQSFRTDLIAVSPWNSAAIKMMTEKAKAKYISSSLSFEDVLYVLF